MSKMKRIEFSLGMSGVSAWDGRWSGSSKNYTIVRGLSSTRSAALLSGKDSATWFHHWPDGWCASVTARVMGKGERRKKSDGFCGYGWMVSNILSYGHTAKP